MNVALGNEVIIYDYGARKPIPRALYQGVEFLKYVLNKRWLNREYITDVSRSNRKHTIQNCNSYFEQCYLKLDDRTKKKLDYFKPYILTDKILIETVSDVTLHDGDKEFYRNILEKANNKIDTQFTDQSLLSA